MSGMNINHTKLELLISLNCRGNKRKWFNGILEVRSIREPAKYLGIEIGKLNKKKEFYKPMLDKMQRRIAGWKSKLLSQGETHITKGY